MTRIGRPVSQSQSHINSKMRAILCDWLHEVQHKFRLPPAALHLTVRLLDRFLESEQVKRNKLHLVGATAMWIAEQYMHVCKRGGRELGSCEDYVYICDKAYPEEEINAMERCMLKFFSRAGFPFSTPTALSTLSWLIRQVSFPSGSKSELVAKYLVDLTLQAALVGGAYK